MASDTSGALGAPETNINPPTSLRMGMVGWAWMGLEWLGEEGCFVRVLKLVEEAFLFRF